MVTQSSFDCYTWRAAYLLDQSAHTRQTAIRTLLSLHTLHVQSTSVGDELAKTVGKVPEKISLHRGVAVHSSDSPVIG